MRVVRRIARSGRSVVCTIHQPSGELFYLFDRLVLLGSGGHQIYFGDLGHRSTRFIKYLQSVPGVKPIPARYNPASWMLEELGVGVTAVKETTEDNASKETQAEMIQRFKAFYFKSRVYRRTAARIKALETLSGTEEPIEYSVSRVAIEDREVSYSVSVAPAALPTTASTIEQKDAPSMWYQYKLLQARHTISYWRNPPFIFMRMKVRF
jgi:ABC-type multidrug transport system ATPase subunit